MRGVSKGDCFQKITDKYGIHFTPLREKIKQKPWFLGGKEYVEVEFYLNVQRGFAMQNGEPAIPVSGVSASRSQAAAAMGRPARHAAAAAARTLPKEDTTLDFEEEKKRLLVAAGKDPDQVFRQVKDREDAEETQRKFLEELKELRDEFREKMELKNSAKKEEHDSIVRMGQILRQNSFGERYIVNLLERARKELPLDTLEDFSAVQDKFLEWIGESVKIYKIQDKPQKISLERNPRILVLVGPTGVGKTTTVAKLAAVYGRKPGCRQLSVRIITIDSFRIGGSDQMKKYGDIMDIPVFHPDNRRDLRKEIDLLREEADLILVDTVGRSPRDSAKLGEMKELLDACGSTAEIHLVISASTQICDIENILRQFEPFHYQAVLLTKLDETTNVGNVISALKDRDKPVSYITNGQGVPKDIKKADVIWFLTNLEGFRVDREKMEERFPVNKSDQFQWS